MKKLRCPRCGNMYDCVTLNVICCPDCVRKKDEQLYILHCIIRENAGLSPFDLSKITGVPVEIVLKNTKGGFLEYSFKDIEYNDELEQRVQEGLEKARLCKRSERFC